VVKHRRRERGFTLMEIVVALAVFGIFVMVLVQVNADMTYYERKYPVNFMAHPQAAAVLSRLRRDVSDITPPYYPETAEGGYVQGPKTLIVDILQDGAVKHLIWDFSIKGEVHRISYNVGVPTEWVAYNVPEFLVDSFQVANKPDAVRILAKDEGGRLAVDQIFSPRPHQ
jgi:prepilin-type N-terminal cleavage/methylation domain-containing protein